MNYFELLNLEQIYKIDQKQLLQNYCKLQAKYHPDQFNTKEAKDKNLKISANINKAYNILKDDVTRAQHLLELNHFKLEEIVDKNLLIEIWEDREELENILSHNNLSKFCESQHNKKQKLQNSLINAFENNQMQDALDVLTRLKYLKQLINSCEIKLKNALK